MNLGKYFWSKTHGSWKYILRDARNRADGL